MAVTVALAVVRYTIPTFCYGQNLLQFTCIAKQALMSSNHKLRLGANEHQFCCLLQYIQGGISRSKPRLNVFVKDENNIVNKVFIGHRGGK